MIYFKIACCASVTSAINVSVLSLSVYPESVKVELWSRVADLDTRRVNRSTWDSDFSSKITAYDEDVCVDILIIGLPPSSFAITKLRDVYHGMACITSGCYLDGSSTYFHLYDAEAIFQRHHNSRIYRPCNLS